MQVKPGDVLEGDFWPESPRVLTVQPSRGAQRRPRLQEEAMAGRGTTATGVVNPGSVDESAAARATGIARSTEPDDRGTKPSDRATSRKVPGSAAVDDTSGSRCADGTGLRADYRGHQPV